MTVALTGQKFGYLTVLRRAPRVKAKGKTAHWVCRCDCGTTVTRQSQYLRNIVRIYPRSCGCHHGNQSHKQANTRVYYIWSGLRGRCLNTKNKDWGNYGGRGIGVCATWERSFEAFWADMGPTYQHGLTLDRRDNNGSYSPENCRWVSTKVQANNRRTNVLLDTPRGAMTVAQAAQAYGLKPDTLRARLHRYKWPLLRALTGSTT